MSVTDELLSNAAQYAAGFGKGDLAKDAVRGFGYDVATGALREVA